MKKEIYTKNGSQTYQIVFNESFRLFSSNDSVAFDLHFEKIKWTIGIHFTNDLHGVNYGINSNVVEADNGIHINLNRWYSPNQLEFTSPLEFKSKDNKIQLSVLVTSICTQINKGRNLSVTIWRKIIL